MIYNYELESSLHVQMNGGNEWNLNEWMNERMNEWMLERVNKKEGMISIDWKISGECIEKRKK